MKLTRLLLVLAAVMSIAVFAPGEGGAAIVTFSGSNAGAGPTDPRPTADAAASSFNSAAALFGNVGLINFEGFSTGFNASFTAAPGVTATFSGDYDPIYSGIFTNSATPTVMGYNTTAGGTKYLGISPNFNYFSGNTTTSLTFSFADPINAFGAYITGLESAIAGTVKLNFFDGSSQSYKLTDLAGGGVQFFGFTDTLLVASIVFQETLPPGTGLRDIWGLDDIRYAAAAVPETSSILLIASGLLGIVAYRKRMRMS